MNLPTNIRRTAIASTGFALAAALVLTVSPRLARADAQQQQSFNVWHQMSDCARLAAKQYPDHTTDGNAKREAFRQNCLRQHHLPVVPAGPAASPATGQ
ncbi:MAG TPA: hypothetical protein VGF92_05660 [Stellaceae bacterium]|jgi:hypothetical protein